MATLKKQFGATVRRLRIEAGLSQEKLAEKAGVSRNFQGSIERGESSLSLDLAAQFAQALAMPLSELLALVEEDMKSPDPQITRRRVRRS